MKHIFCSLFVLVLCFKTFPQNNGLITDNNVRIRNMPSIEGHIIGVLNAMDPIKVYNFSGSGKNEGDVWDYWVSISKNNDQWINAYWIALLPLYYNTILYDDEGSGIEQFRIINNVIINDNEILYTTVTFNSGEIYYKKEEQFLKGNELGLNHRDARKSFVIHSILQSPDLQKIMIDKNKSISDKGSYAYYRSEGILIKEALYYGTPVLKSFEITNSDIMIFFGISVGISQDELVDIIGIPLEESDDCYIYINNTGGSNEILKFRIKNNKVVKISYLLEN